MKKIMMFSVLLLAGTAGVASYPVLADYTVAVSLEDAAKTLNHLVERAIDGQKGFEEAAEHVAPGQLKDEFISKSSQRAKFAAELKNKVREMGREAEDEGTVAGIAHRAWIDVKTAVTPNESDNKAVLEAVRAGEEKALADYRDALKKELPKDVYSLVQKQREEIESSYQWADKRLKEEEAKKSQS